PPTFLLFSSIKISSSLAIKLYTAPILEIEFSHRPVFPSPGHRAPKLFLENSSRPFRLSNLYLRQMPIREDSGSEESKVGETRRE
ncbi:hypothetical protein VIGAN_08083000, partial [Vigna angularis var. angularis]